MLTANNSVEISLAAPLLAGCSHSTRGLKIRKQASAAAFTVATPARRSALGTVSPARPK